MLEATEVRSGLETALPSVAAPALSPVTKRDWSGWFVWASWATMLMWSLVAVLHSGRNVPIHEDWEVVAAAKGNQPHFLEWLWTFHNEHRVPVPRLIYIGLLKIWPDFRVGMVFNIVLLGAVAAGFIVAARRIRGRARWTDAFFPVALLHLGHWENLGWSWQIQFVVATALACVVLMAFAGRGWSWPRAAAGGVALAIIPLTGATSQPFVPFIAVAMAVIGWRHLHRQSEDRFSNRAVVLLGAAAAVSLGVTMLNVIDASAPFWTKASPNVHTTLETAAKFLGMGFGPAAGAAWFYAALAGALAIAVAMAVLVPAVRRHRGSERDRAILMLAFLAGAVALAGGLGASRAGVMDIYGLPDRYALLLVPGLCCAYLAWEQFGGRTVRRVGPALLCIGIIAALPVNVKFGSQWRDWYETRVDTFASDARAGVPADVLAYDRPLAFEQDRMSWAITFLRNARVGVFADIRESWADRPPSQAVDGLPVAVDDWQTAGSPQLSSLDVVDSGEGRRAIRWKYNVRGRAWAVMGRRFTTPQDWRGAGYLELTVRGEGRGQGIRVRVATLTDDKHAKDPFDRWDAWFLDDRTGRRTIVIPWDGFNHFDPKANFDWKGPMRLDRVVGFAFIEVNRDQGSLTVERVALRGGRAPRRFPFHPAAARHSIGPWH